MEGQETPQAAGEQPAAGFWVRGGAVAIDILVLSIVQKPIAWVMASAGLGALIPAAVNFLVGVAYYTAMIANRGQTVGKMAAGVKVIRMDGSPISVPRALARYLAAMASGLFLLGGYILGAFTDKKRTFHDFIVDTRVIYPAPVEAWRKATMATLAVLLLVSPLALIVLMIADPRVSAYFKQPGETQSAYDKFQALENKAKMGATLGALGSFRAALSIYYGDAEGVYPSDPRELISPKGPPPTAAMKYPYLKTIPNVQVQDHAPTSEIEFYGNEICGKDAKGDARIDATRLRDTGRWGYVGDKASRCWGMLFVDCRHSTPPSTNHPQGEPWYSY